MSSLMEGNWNAPSPAFGCEVTTGSSAERYVRGGGLRFGHLYYLDMNSTDYVFMLMKNKSSKLWSRPMRRSKISGITWSLQNPWSSFILFRAVFNWTFKIFDSLTNLIRSPNLRKTAQQNYFDFLQRNVIVLFCEARTTISDNQREYSIHIVLGHRFLNNSNKK